MALQNQNIIKIELQQYKINDLQMTDRLILAKFRGDMLNMG